MHVLDYAIFALLVVANFIFGLYFSFRKPSAGDDSGVTAKDIFLGSRTLRTLPLAASTVASIFSSTGLVAMPAYYYAYGWHNFWGAMLPMLLFPFGTIIFLPVVYKLGITSIFEYIRLRFNAKISLTACAVYIFLTQSVGAISITAASLTLQTVFHIPMFWCNIAIGLSGTVYTALGGLRGVVWTDCLQFTLVLAAPATVILKIAVDSLSPSSTIRPISDLNVSNYVADYRFDMEDDENIWTVFLGSFTALLYRVCFDQVAAQRLMASRTLKEAKRTVVTSSFLASFTYCLPVSVGVALTVWFRGCDPLLSGAISSIDQILPYYVKTHLVHVPGLIGLFLAGVVCAATSTTSSTINSQAAILYVDVIAPRWKKASLHLLWITRGSALGLGIMMTIYSTVCIYMGSLGRVFLMVYTCLTSPFIGLCFLGLLFPFVHSKGAGVATTIVVIYQLWHLKHTIERDAKPARMPVSLEYCSVNQTINATAFTPNIIAPFESTESQHAFSLFRISYFWISLFGVFATVIIGILVSAITDHQNHSSHGYQRMYHRGQESSSAKY